jgi:hypothetical protein
MRMFVCRSPAAHWSPLAFPAPDQKIYVQFVWVFAVHFLLVLLEGLFIEAHSFFALMSKT